MALNFPTFPWHSPLVGRALLALALVACSHPRPSPAPVPIGPPDSATVILGHGPPAPYRLDRLIVALDGAVIARIVPSARVPRGPLARLDRLPHGDHTLTALFVLSRPCSPLGDAREKVELRWSETFGLDGRPAALVLRIDEGVGVSMDGEPVPPLTVTLRGRGFVRSDFIAARGSVDDAACLLLREPARALCRVTTRMTQARVERDIVWLTCLNDKRQALAEIAADLVELGEATDPEVERARAVLFQRVELLTQESLQCLGLDMAYYAAPVTGRFTELCEGPDPFEDDGAFASRP